MKIRPNLVSVIRTSNGDPYHINIKMDEDSAGRFLKEMWGYIRPSLEPKDFKEALVEWTGRMECIRTNYDPYDEIVTIRTHGFSPEQDTLPLHFKVINFLREKGLEV